jgi:pimeloyl-ACP methyl ester carboxylesterase
VSPLQRPSVRVTVRFTRPGCGRPNDMATLRGGRSVPVTGAPVVMIHGWGGSFERTWVRPGVSLLVEEEGRPVIGVDLLGHGDAPKPHDPAAYADMTPRILDALPEGPVDAMGFSLGAITLLQTVVRHPERFGKVVLAGIGNLIFDGGSGMSEKVAEALESGDPSEGSVKALVGYANDPGNDTKALAAVMRRPMPPDPITKERCAAVTSQVLVCIGDADFAYPADELAAAFPHGELKVLKRCDHFATPEDFGFIDAVLRFLSA